MLSTSLMAGRQTQSTRATPSALRPRVGRAPSCCATPTAAPRPRRSAPSPEPPSTPCPTSRASPSESTAITTATSRSQTRWRRWRRGRARCREPSTASASGVATPTSSPWQPTWALSALAPLRCLLRTGATQASRGLQSCHGLCTKPPTSPCARAKPSWDGLPLRTRGACTRTPCSSRPRPTSTSTPPSSAMSGASSSPSSRAVPTSPHSPRLQRSRTPRSTRRCSRRWCSSRIWATSSRRPRPPSSSSCRRPRAPSHPTSRASSTMWTWRPQVPACTGAQTQWVSLTRPRSKSGSRTGPCATRWPRATALWAPSTRRCARASTTSTPLSRTFTSSTTRCAS
mmetsp:Transcript_16943/g.45604  ORF Transcript_16943/g.45604 Transcript_16943/m.45604 type:complete len:342 (-) Transcript_16943:494-1519(-)